jgi:hypothetical protein
MGGLIAWKLLLLLGLSLIKPHVREIRAKGFSKVFDFGFMHTSEQPLCLALDNFQLSEQTAREICDPPHVLFTFRQSSTSSKQSVHKV